MKKQSFHEILKEKMAPQEAAPSPELPRFDELLESISPFFQIPSLPVKSVKSYAVAKPVRVATPTPEVPKAPVVRFVYKNDLTDEEQSKWNLFEQTFSKSLGDSVTRSQIMTAFRSFAKKHHPDVTQSADATNFAVIVKIKDEFLTVIEKKLKATNSTEASL